MIARLFAVSVALALVLALVGSVRIARADDKPWVVGVSADHQKAALDLYQQGNKFFVQAEYKDALAKYEQALLLWDHPAIRYNAAVCLINLDRTLEAYEALLAALRYGAAPLAGDLYNQGVSYQKLLAGRVGEVEVSCNDVGAEVRLDGKLLFHGPGSATRRLLTGEHQVVTVKPRFQTETTPIVLKPGDKQTIAITLKPAATARVLHRRWSKWVPWSVIVGGAVVGVVGAGVYVDGKSSRDRYDTWFDTNCPAPTHACGAPGTTAIPGDIKALPARVETESKIAVSAFAVGGALVATGFVLVVLNQPRLGAVTPTVGSDHLGLAITGRW